MKKKQIFLILKLVFMFLILVICIYVTSITSKNKSPISSNYLSLTKVKHFYDIKTSENNIWFGTNKGLRRYCKDKEIWYTYTSFEGLVENNVQSIAIDNNIIWCGTWGGVSKYDTLNKQWKNFTIADGLPSNQIWSIDYNEKYVGIGTNGKGFCFYDKNKNEFKTFDETNGLKDNYVHCVKFYKDKIWLGSQKGILSCYNLITKEIINYQSEDNFNIFYNMAICDNKIWLASKNGVYKFDSDKNTWQKFTTKDGLSHDSSYSIVIKKNDIWVGTEKGICKYSQDLDIWLKFNNPYFITTYDKKTIIESISCDDNYIWCGTYEKGIGRFDEKNGKWQLFYGGLVNNYIKTLVNTGKDIWMGFDYQIFGANKYNFEEKTYKFYPIPNTKIIIDDEAYVWFGTWKGLRKYDKNKDTWQKFTTEQGLIANDIISLLSDENFLWIGTYYGLSLLDKTTEKTQTFFKNKEIVSLSKNENTVFVSDNNGKIYAYEKKDKKWKEIFDKKKVKINQIIATKDFLWIGTQNGIFKYFILTKKIKKYYSKDIIFSFLKQGDYLYIGTNKGLRIHNLKNTKWKKITKEQGLLDDEIFSLTNDVKYIWIGSQFGVTRIDQATF
ncbi:MAG: hypothetical protein ABIB46_03610 [bacterium]